MAIIYTDRVLWYCEECGDEGTAGSQGEAERQVERHECVLADE